MLFGVRFFVGLATGGILVVICTWIMELLLAEQRMVLRGVFNWGWTRIFLTTICYFTQNWRHASIVCALLTLPAIFLGALCASRVADVEIARHSSSAQCLASSEECSEFLATSGDTLVYVILFGAILVASKLVLLAVDTKYPRFSRRKLHQGAQIATCFCFAVLAAMTWIGYHGPIFLVISLLGTVFIEYTWDACYLCAIESMQTTLRASATGTCSFWARIGAILAPFLNMATAYWSPAIYWAVIVLGLVNLAISWRFLVETKNVDLAEVDFEHDFEEEHLELRNK
ncbi:unnamed protein product [Caenorhabditis angaria]|uniref:Major facilitator superfamily (MFS) profile domain-containing protein n=1 Tax=Caenorhabditis angaria TaxID=860376 RepID=A0A9P1IQC7_9PELO|nr:unnamed protein product [Caenorhabditis angaria]